MQGEWRAYLSVCYAFLVACLTLSHPARIDGSGGALWVVRATWSEKSTFAGRTPWREDAALAQLWQLANAKVELVKQQSHTHRHPTSAAVQSLDSERCCVTPTLAEAQTTPQRGNNHAHAQRQVGHTRGRSASMEHSSRLLAVGSVDTSASDMSLASTPTTGAGAGTRL